MSSAEPNWCPGCGNFGIQAAIKGAVDELGLGPENVVISTGIGCGSKVNQWAGVYGFAGLHGRSLPVAMGVKLANPDLTVIASGGDGDGYGIGMAHFINTMRRNIDITYIVQNNALYALTLGQVSPTTAKGGKGPSTPHGVIEEPVNPLRLALSSGCSFVARGFSGDAEHLKGLVKEAIEHKGFSFIDVLQVCPSFNKVNTFGYYKERIYKLDGDRGDLSAAFEKAAAWAGQAGEWGDRIPIGVFYQAEKGVYEDEDVGLKSGAPVGADLGRIDVGEMMESFM